MDKKCRELILKAVMKSIDDAMDGEYNLTLVVKDKVLDVSYDLGKEVKINESENTEAVPLGTEEEGGCAD